MLSISDASSYKSGFSRDKSVISLIERTGTDKYLKWCMSKRYPLTTITPDELLTAHISKGAAGTQSDYKRPKEFLDYRISSMLKPAHGGKYKSLENVRERLEQWYTPLPLGSQAANQDAENAQDSDEEDRSAVFTVKDRPQNPTARPPSRPDGHGPVKRRLSPSPRSKHSTLGSVGE